MIQFIKELYFTAFTLGYKFRTAGGWQRLNHRFGTKMDQGKGVLFVSIIELFLLKGIESHIEIYTRTRFLFDSSFGVIIIISFAFYCANYYALIVRGHGMRFERDFKDLKRSKKFILVASFAVLLLATITFCIYSDSAYRRFFHIES
jgi:hypothetical protein